MPDKASPVQSSRHVPSIPPAHLASCISGPGTLRRFQSDLVRPPCSSLRMTSPATDHPGASGGLWNLPLSCSAGTIRARTGQRTPVSLYHLTRIANCHLPPPRSAQPASPTRLQHQQARQTIDKCVPWLAHSCAPTLWPICPIPPNPLTKRLKTGTSHAHQLASLIHYPNLSKTTSHYSPFAHTSELIHRTSYERAKTACPDHLFFRRRISTSCLLDRAAQRPRKHLSQSLTWRTETITTPCHLHVPAALAITKVWPPSLAADKMIRITPI